MERHNSLMNFINALNADGKLQYNDYSVLFDLAADLDGLEEEIDAARTDIVALLWLNGNCEYCAHGEKEEFSGAYRWRCALGRVENCKPEWRGILRAESDNKKPAPHKPECKPTSRAERLFGPRETWTTGAAPAAESDTAEYKGFLLIKCPECGEIRGFCAKQPIRTYRCDCGGETRLQDLIPAYLTCKCGKRFKYRTNIRDKAFTYRCLACGAPVDLVLHEKAKTYETVG